MTTNDHTAAAWSPEDLIGSWQHDATIIEFQWDGSYRIVTIVEACPEEIVSCGKCAVEQSELKLDPVIENEADPLSKATYKAVYRVDLRNPDQLDLPVSPCADDQNAKRKELLDGRELQRIAGDDSLVLTVRETSKKIRKHLDSLTPTAHTWWGPSAIAWLLRVGTGQALFAYGRENKRLPSVSLERTSARGEEIESGSFARPLNSKLLGCIIS